jgi:hypothetical protein
MRATRKATNKQKYVVFDGVRVSIGHFHQRACDWRGQCQWENKIKMGGIVPCEAGVGEEAEWNIEDTLVLAVDSSSRMGTSLGEIKEEVGEPVASAGSNKTQVNQSLMSRFKSHVEYVYRQ